MNVIGIIAEYNPFHNGHLYQLNNCKSLSDSDYSVVVLGGDFLQRGEPACVSKYLRTRMALSCGADLVLALPGIPSCGSAPYFAGGGISLLKHLGMVTHLGFGSESGDIDALMRFADEKANLDVKRIYDKDHNPAKALADQLDIGSDIPRPNDTLAIEYLTAIQKQKASIKPVTIKREGAGYHSKTLDTSYSSASAIRDILSSSGSLDQLKDQMPQEAFMLLAEYLKTQPILSLTDCYSLMRYALLHTEDPSQIFDISSDLANRLKQYMTQYAPMEDWLHLIKSKNYTYSHITRAMTHLMLQIKKELVDTYLELDEAPYLRILGFRKSATPLLKQIKAHSDLPIISKMADAKDLLNTNQYQIISEDIKYARVYKSLLQTRTQNPILDEVQESPIVL